MAFSRLKFPFPLLQHTFKSTHQRLFRPRLLLWGGPGKVRVLRQFLTSGLILRNSCCVRTRHSWNVKTRTFFPVWLVGGGGSRMKWLKLFTVLAGRCGVCVCYNRAEQSENPEVITCPEVVWCFPREFLAQDDDGALPNPQSLLNDEPRLMLSPQSVKGDVDFWIGGVIRKSFPTTTESRALFLSIGKALFIVVSTTSAKENICVLTFGFFLSGCLL